MSDCHSKNLTLRLLLDICEIDFIAVTIEHKSVYCVCIMQKDYGLVSFIIMWWEKNVFRNLIKNEI